MASLSLLRGSVKEGSFVFIRPIVAALLFCAAK
jgi:hypothetical protein